MARTLIQPAELRVGIVTAFVGAPFFLWLLARSVAWSSRWSSIAVWSPVRRSAAILSRVPDARGRRGARRSQGVIVEPRAAAGVFPRTVRDVNGDMLPSPPGRSASTRCPSASTRSRCAWSIRLE